ncbi:MAG: tRNA pseudouridine(13) synthase TruD, partial [Candidatus Micrarchaeia archaeon]
NTAQALGEIARKIRVKPKRFNFAGTKDRNAISTQLVSAFAVVPKRLLGLKLTDLKIGGAWLASTKIGLGDLTGNRFTITLTSENCGVDVCSGRIKRRVEDLNFLVANFFGQQRFGSLRKNTAQVGKLILKGNFEGAVLNYLCFVDASAKSERETGAIDARCRLEKERDFTKALEYFPGHLKYEQVLLRHLSDNSNDFVGALRKLPRSVLLLFVHAFQSLLFNEFLYSKLECRDEKEEANIIGFESVLSQEEELLLEKHGVAKESFKVKGIPEISSKGAKRRLFVKLSDFEILQEKPLLLRFSLPSGSYATVALDQLLSS